MSRTAFLNVFVTELTVQSRQPIPFETLDVWHNCNGTVSMRWLTTRSALNQPTEAAAIPVPGLVILETGKHLTYIGL